MQKSSVKLGNEGMTFLDILRALVRRKWWFVAGLLVVLLLSLLYLSYASPVYESRVRVRIGQVGGNGPFEAADVLASRLLAGYGMRVADGIVRDRPYLARAVPSRSVPGLLDLEAHGDTAEDAAQLLTRIHAEVMKRHDGIYERSIRELNASLASMEKQKAELEKQFEESDRLLRKLGDTNPMQASLLVIERGRISDSMIKLSSEKPQFVQRLAPPFTQPTELLGEIVTPRTPFAPRMDLVLALALVLGSILGAMLALGIELLQRFRGPF